MENSSALEMETIREAYESLTYIQTSMLLIGMDSRGEIMEMTEQAADIKALYQDKIGRNVFFRHYRRMCLYIEGALEGLTPVYFFRMTKLTYDGQHDSTLGSYYVHYVDYCANLLQVSGGLINT